MNDKPSCSAYKIYFLSTKNIISYYYIFLLSNSSFSSNIMLYSFPETNTIKSKEFFLISEVLTCMMWKQTKISNDHQ
jgi:hypothetical protein